MVISANLALRKVMFKCSIAPLEDAVPAPIFIIMMQNFTKYMYVVQFLHLNILLQKIGAKNVPDIIKWCCMALKCPTVYLDSFSLSLGINCN